MNKKHSDLCAEAFLVNNFMKNIINCIVTKVLDFTFDKILKMYTKEKNNLFFVQIGAHDEYLMIPYIDILMTKDGEVF